MPSLGKFEKWLTTVFVLLEAVLIALAYMAVVPAHKLAPVSIVALIFYVALMVVAKVWRRKDKHDKA